MTNKKHHTLILVALAMFCTQMLKAQSYSNSLIELSEEITANVQEEQVSSVNKWDYFMYPVPASSELNVKITKGDVNITTVIVTNESGDEVMYLEDQDASRLKLDIIDFKPGQYYIRIITDAFSTPKMKRFYVSK